MMPLFQYPNENKIYSEKEIIHRNIIENIAKLILELPLENIHEQFYVLCYLLWNGYFSIDKMYSYNNTQIQDENNTIFLGRGCCRHHADLLNEVYKKLKISSSSIPVRLVKTKLKNNMDIEINIERFVENKIPLYEYNHKICTTLSDESSFLFDPTNLTECEIIGKSKIICFNGIYKINTNLFRKDFTNIYEFNNKPSLTKKELKQFYECAKDICNNNKKLFEDFYSDNVPNYQEIKTLTLK